MRMRWALAALALLMVSTPHAQAQRGSTKTVEIPSPADAGFEECPRAGETFQQMNARLPRWFQEIMGRIPQGPMAYRVFEPVGMRVLVAEGAIGANEADNLRLALNRAKPIDEVWFNSPGGVSSEGVRMGEVLRRAGVAARVPSGYSCISACSVAFLGGVIRSLDSGAIYGVHMFTAASAYRGQSDALQARGYEREQAMDLAFGAAEQNAAKRASERSQYLVRMGISLRWMDEAFGVNASCVKYLSRAKLRDLNVINN